MAPNNFGAARAASKKRKLAAAASAPTDPDAALNPSTNTTNTTTKGKGKGKKFTLAEPPRPKKASSIGKLQWKSIILPSELGFDEDGGLLELDEVEGVDVVYADGRVTFQVKDEPEVELASQPPSKKQKKAASASSSADLPFPTTSKPSAEEMAALEADGFIFDEPDVVIASDQEDFEEVDEDEEEWVPTAVEEVQGEPMVGQEKPKVVQEEKVEQIKEEEVPVVEEVPNKVKAKKEKGKAKAEEPMPAVVAPAVEEEFNVATALPAWSHLSLPVPIFRALSELGFAKPTDIQERALSVEIGAAPYVPKEEDEPAADAEADEEWGGITDAADETPAIVDPPPEPYVSAFEFEDLAPPANTTDRDIVGVAQTGSGKTLAYGLPILSYILSTPPSTSTDATRLSALILAPTRELALQVRSALSEVAIRTNRLLPEELQDPNVNAPRKRERTRHVSVVALTGGMSVEKQKRQLSRGVDILVATPGRLWDLIGEDDTLAKAIKGIKFLVIDEADRMIENGHFAELENIVRLTRRKLGEDTNDYEDDFKSSEMRNSKVDSLLARPDMRTFVFSATMSKDLQRNLKKKNRRFKPGQPEDGMSSLDDLLLKLDFRDPDPEVIDLSPEGGLVETLKECKLECMMLEKDVHLYNFLLRYPGRTIVFLSSIDGIRRLLPLLTLLRLNVISLHSGMQQRARLKALDRFKVATNAVLLATDVAARGLDIPSVSHVVHYNLPRSADVYVHRSGRTARAGQEGLALQLVAPDEKQVQKLLMVSLGKSIDLPTLPVDYSVLDKLKERVDLAKKIDSGMHKVTKEAHDDNWLKQAAAAMDIDLDSDNYESDDDTAKDRKVVKTKAGNVRDLKAQLAALLDKPVVMRGVSAKYLTTRGRVDFVDQLVQGTNHAGIMGAEITTALEAMP